MTKELQLLTQSGERIVAFRITPFVHDTAKKLELNIGEIARDAIVKEVLRKMPHARRSSAKS